MNKSRKFLLSFEVHAEDLGPCILAVNSFRTSNIQQSVVMDEPPRMVRDPTPKEQQPTPSKSAAKKSPFIPQQKRTRDHRWDEFGLTGMDHIIIQTIAAGNGTAVATQDVITRAKSLGYRATGIHKQFMKLVARKMIDRTAPGMYRPNDLTYDLSKKIADKNKAAA